MINFIFRIVLPTGASKVVQTHKFVDFLDVTQFFQIWPDSVLIEMNDVKNNNINNFEHRYQLPKVHGFLSRSL